MLFQRGIFPIWIAIQIFLLLHLGQCTHISGTFNTNEYFRFLMKFGFQQTDRHRQRDSCGYIFGNITTRTNSSKHVTLAVLDRSHFLEYYGNRTHHDRNMACAMMFNTLNESSYDSECNVDGQDYLRYLII